jgi:hypothetical protein
VDGEASDIPSFAMGYWRINSSDAYGGQLSLGVLVSGWKADVSGTYTSEYGTQPINQNWTMLKFDIEGGDSYGVIACYPEYVMNSDDLAEALSDYLDETVTGYSSLELMLTSYSGAAAVYVEDNSSIHMVIPPGKMSKIHVFFATGEWEKWAAANSVPLANRYVKARMVYTGTTKFEMTQLVEVADPDEPWDQTYTFPTLADLEAAEANLVPEHTWMWIPTQDDPYPSEPTDLDVNTMTFTR